MNLRILAVALAALALSCGGDDGGGRPESGPAPEGFPLASDGPLLFTVGGAARVHTGDVDRTAGFLRTASPGLAEDIQRRNAVRGLLLGIALMDVRYPGRYAVLREKAAAFVARVRAGEDFAAAAATVTAADPDARFQVEKGIPLRDWARNDNGLTFAYVRALFSLGKPGEISAPVPSWIGVHVIQYTSLEPGASRLEDQRQSRQLWFLLDPAAEKEQALSRIFAETLQRTRVKVHDNRFRDLVPKELWEDAVR